MRALDLVRRFPDRQATSFPVALTRAGVGVAALIEAFEVAGQLRAFHNPDLLTLPRLDWFAVVPASATNLFLGTWLLAAAAFCLGWRTRPAGVVLTGFLAYVLVLDRQLYSNHLYLMTILTVLLTLADSGASFSIDSRRRGVRHTIPAWPVALIRLQVSIVYAFAAATKLNLVYLSGLVLRTQLRLPGLDAVPPALFALAAAGSVATELFLAFALWKPRLRPLAFLVGVGFHLTILVTMRVIPDLLVFALLMVSAYMAFFSRLTPPVGVRHPRASMEPAARA